MVNVDWPVAEGIHALPVDMDKLTKALATNDKIYGQR